jgi:hypothetical protein
MELRLPYPQDVGLKGLIPGRAAARVEAYFHGALRMKDGSDFEA